MSNPKHRILKVHKKFRARTFDSTVIPQIRLEGEWLAALGFTQGQSIIIQQEKHKLIITLAPASGK